MKTKAEINEIAFLKFILKTKGRFPYAWAKNVQVFDLKEVRKRLKFLKNKK